MGQATIGIDTNVGLHAKVPLIAFLGLMHLRIALLLFVLGRAGCHLQLGADKGIRIESAMLYTGLIFTHTSTNAELSGSYYGDTKSYGLGGYTSIFFDNGFYTDFIAKYIHSTNVYSYLSPSEPPRVSWRVFYL